MTPRARISDLALLGLGGVLHLALLVYYAPLGLVFSGVPFHTYDYALHVYQVDRAARAFAASGRLWGYDPLMLAGQPSGAVEDLTSKSLELFVVAARGLGVSTWVAFDVYVLAIFVALPVVAYVSARLFELPRRTAALAVIAWVLLWYFDSLLHWCWYVGMISWGAASYLAVLVVALMYRAVRDHDAGKYAALAAVTALVTLVHPFAALTLVVPLASLYVRHFRSLRAWEHAALAGGTLAAASTALVWIFPALRFRHYIGTVDAFLWPTFEYVLFDSLDLLKDVLMTGAPVRTVLRTSTFALAAVAAVHLARKRDDRLLPLVTLAFGSFVLAYASGYSAALRQTQPYRHVGPAVLAAALAAAAALRAVFHTDRLAELTRPARLALVLASCLALPAVLRTVLGYMPTALPERVPPRTAFRPGPRPGTDSREPPLTKLGLAGPEPEYVAMGRYLQEHFTPDLGRVASFDWVLGEYLPVFAGLPTLGGIPQRNIPHVAAHPLRFDFTPSADEPDPFRRYLQEFGVAAVVMSGDPSPVDLREDLLSREASFGQLRLYRVRAPSGYVADGRARVTAQDLNAIQVRNADPIVTLRFHFLETLACRPDCSVERAVAFRDAAGFVRVRSKGGDFELYNTYD
jgi:hypothetical protein